MPVNSSASILRRIFSSWENYGHVKQVVSHDVTNFDSISFCRACKWSSWSLSISTSFWTHNTSCEYKRWSVTERRHYGLRSSFDAYVLVSWLGVKDQFIAYMGGTFQNNYIMPEYYQKGFSPTMVKDSFLVICLKFCSQTFEIFYTKPIILISWYYLWVQISEAA